MLLGDMGARIIKIEQPGRGDDTRAWGPPFVAGESTYFLSVNRNKESVTLDFKTPRGRELLDQLIGGADVVVENFRPGTLARLGLGHESVRRTHPRLIYCSISGFGHTGPRSSQPGYDAVVQAEGGLMSITGDAAGPPFRTGVAIADLTAGLLAVQGIALALFARERSGEGQFVDVALFDSVVSLLSSQASANLNASYTPARLGNRHPQIAPYDIFPASDGEFFLAVGNDHAGPAQQRGIVYVYAPCGDGVVDPGQECDEGRVRHGVVLARQSIRNERLYVRAPPAASCE